MNKFRPDFALEINPFPNRTYPLAFHESHITDDFLNTKLSADNSNDLLFLKIDNGFQWFYIITFIQPL